MTDLARRLSHLSARELARLSGWGRTTVTEIKKGIRTPSRVQLEDLLTAAGARVDEAEQWLSRYDGMNAIRPALDPPPQGEIPRREGIRTRWVAAVALTLLLGAMFAAWAIMSGNSDRPVSGQVSCVTGAAVVGIWVTDGDGGSWARTRPGPDGWVLYNGSSGADTYRLNVGCGGTPSQWQTETRSPEFASDYLSLVCDDRPQATEIAPFFGRCHPQAP